MLSEPLETPAQPVQDWGEVVGAIRRDLERGRIMLREVSNVPEASDLEPGQMMLCKSSGEYRLYVKFKDGSLKHVVLS